MHRTALGALVAALALTFTAHGAPTTSDHTPRIKLASAAVAVAMPVEHAPATGACRAGLVALTFDDGPSPYITPGLVRTLLKYDVPATFFMVGSRVHASPETARLVQQSGFQIANHTWDHRQLTALPDDAVLRELRRTRRELRSHHIPASNLMRPPYGAINPRVAKDVRKVGLVPVLWSIDSRDWVGGNARQIANRVLGAIRPHRTNLVLQHDGVNNSPNSVAAVPLIIQGARRRGFCFAEIGPAGKVAVPVPAVHATIVPGSEDGPSAIRVRLDLDRPTTREVSLRVQTTPGTATAGQDYTPTMMRVTFPRGAGTVWFSVPVKDDKTKEPTEDVGLLLDRPSGVSLPRPTYLASIFSDE